MVTFIGYKQRINFGTVKFHLSKAGTFHQEVLHQRIDSRNYFLHRFGIVVFLVHAFRGIFSLAQANGKNGLVLDFYWRGNFPFVAIYFISNIQIVQIPKRN